MTDYGVWGNKERRPPGKQISYTHVHDHNRDAFAAMNAFHHVTTMLCYKWSS